MIVNLAEQLQSLSPDHPVWITPDHEVIHASQVARWSKVSSQYEGARIAIETPSSLELAKWLVALDGVCEAIVLLPSSLSSDQRDSLKEQAGVNVEVSSFEPSDDPSRDAKRDFETQWIIATSGTTGTPKLVSHTLKSLTRTASFDLEIGRKHVWSSLYNLVGFAGLQVFLQAWCGGSPFVLHDESTSLSDQVRRMARHQVTALSATPTMWRKMLMASDAAAMPLRRITLGGEVCDQKVLDALEQTFPQAKVRQIYASTETGVGFSVRDGVAGFPVSFLHDPPPGIEIQVEDGRLLLRNPASTQEFLGSDLKLYREDGFIDTGDIVKQVGDRFEFFGRANGSINVGGNKVHPEEVERFLMTLGGVAQARVFAKKSPFTGSLVAADVVVQPGCDPSELKIQITAECRRELDAYKVPAMIRLVDKIETNAAGKVLRNAG